MRRKVLFPLPDVPIIPKNSPSFTVKFNLCKTKCFLRSSYDFPKFVICIILFSIPERLRNGAWSKFLRNQLRHQGNLWRSGTNFLQNIVIYAASRSTGRIYVPAEFDTNKKALSDAGHPSGAVWAGPPMRAAGFRDGLLQRGCTVHVQGRNGNKGIRARGTPHFHIGDEELSVWSCREMGICLYALWPFSANIQKVVCTSQ